jgi:hypothetical protein
MRRRVSLLATLLCSSSLILACGGKEDPAADGPGSGGEESSGESGESGGATTDTGDTGGTSDTGGSGMTSGAFIDTDMSMMTCGTFCDIWTPGDCPAGEKCTAVGCDPAGPWDSNVCVEIMGDKVPGDSCNYLGPMTDSGLDDCQNGALCYDRIPPDDTGVCVEFCSGSAAAPTCPTGSLCRIVNDGVLPICLFECDPLSAVCPNPDNLCLPAPSGEGFQCVINASGDDNPPGSGCQYNNSCNQGLLCIDSALVPQPECAMSGLDRCCTEVCSLSGPNNCGAASLGAECVPYFDPMATPPNYEDVGVCALPAPRESFPHRQAHAGEDFDPRVQAPTR